MTYRLDPMPTLIFLIRWDIGRARMGFAQPASSTNTGHPAMPPAIKVNCKNATSGTCLGPQPITASPLPLHPPPPSPPPKKKTYTVQLSYGSFSIPIAVGGSLLNDYNVTADTGSGIVNFACSCCNASSSVFPTLYDPLTSPTYNQPSSSTCLSVAGGTATSDWTYTYHPSGQMIGGIIVNDTLTLPTSSPPLALTSAMLGCILPQGQTGPQEGCQVGGTGGVFGGLDRGNSSIISQVSESHIQSLVSRAHPTASLCRCTPGSLLQSQTRSGFVRQTCPTSPTPRSSSSAAPGPSVL